MTINIYYDKDCPFCSKYAQLIKLKKEHTINILNARESKEKINYFRAIDFDINEGIILQCDDKKIYQGVEAIVFLDNLSEKKMFFSSFYSYIINTKIFKRYLYPTIKAIRKVILKIAGINPTI